jgi:EAL domain-containing protein (putative c-di-GMP-specific phosphodiesterase class I)
MTGALGKSGKVLVVEDDRAILAIVSRILGDVGCEVHQASDGREAVALLRNGDGSGDFDAIISDISMPGMTGIQLLRAIRERDGDVPVVLMTGDPSLETAVQAIEFGALRYITKPFSTKVLSQTVEEAIKLGRMARIKREAFALLGSANAQRVDQADRAAAFDRALGSLWIAYQPIVRVSQRALVAYECLVRNEEVTLASPPALIETAEQLGRLPDLGREIRRQIASTIAESAPDLQFFVNLHLRDLLDDELYAKDSPLTRHASQIVLEVTERASLDSIPDTRARILRLRELGFRIALDDLGAGYAGLSCFALLSPEVVKLDMFLVRNIDRDETKQRLVRSMTNLCRELGMQVICEGIETAAERDALIALGCDDLQGYFFARPARRFPTIQW